MDSAAMIQSQMGGGAPIPPPPASTPPPSLAGPTIDHDRVQLSIKQWRESLVNLDGNNPLLNFKPTKSRSIEFIRHSAAEIYAHIASPSPTYVVGVSPEQHSRIKDHDQLLASQQDVEQLLVEQMEAFNYEDHPGCLFTEKTQQGVDKSLKSTSVKARNEYIDRGIRILYVAFGELRWKTHDKGELRRSPLFLIPVVLEADGPGARPYIKFSDDDPVVNPALALQLEADFGMVLPSAEAVMSAFEEGGITGMLAVYQSLELPDGWEIVDHGILDSFVFANEAIFRDLLDNEEIIASSPIIQSLSGGLGVMDSPFAFEPYGHDVIDQVAEPETSPLVLDADSSQRAAVKAAVEGKSFILDGPPGTGKSQTISNIIGALIEAGKTVLFVSDKAVALDVVRDRLNAKGLGPFLFELHSKKANRKEVAAQLGRALATQASVEQPMSATEVSRLRDIRENLTNYVTASNEIREPLGESFFGVLGRLERLNCEIYGQPFSGNVSELSAQHMAEIENTISQLNAFWPTVLKGKEARWFGTVKQEDPRQIIQLIIPVLDQLQHLLQETKGIRNAFGFNSGTDLQRAANLLEFWHNEPRFQHNHWLDVTDIPSLLQSVTAYTAITTKLDTALQAVTKALGANWQMVQPFTQEQADGLDIAKLAIPGLNAQTTAKEATVIAKQLAQGATCFTHVHQASQALATQMGATPPTTLSGVHQLVATAQALLSDQQPVIDWLMNPRAFFAVKETFWAAQHAYEQLQEVAQEASSAFNEGVLGMDLDEVQRLGEAAKGFFKFMSKERKQVRAMLAEVSPLEWQEALEALPKARQWVLAHTNYVSYAEQTKAALLVLGGSLEGSQFVSVNGEVNWEGVRHAIALTDPASNTTFINRDALKGLVQHPGTQAQVRKIISSLVAMLGEVEHTYLPLATTPGGDNDDLRALHTQVVARAKTLRALNEAIVRAQHLGPDASVDTYVQATKLRAGIDQTIRSANAARAGLHAIAPLDNPFGQASLEEATMIAQKVQWVKSLHMAVTNGRGGHRFTRDQIDALAQSVPITSASTLAGTYREHVDTFLTWFSEERQHGLREDLSDYAIAQEVMRDFQTHAEGIYEWFDLLEVINRIDAIGLGGAFRHAIQIKATQDKVGNFLLATVYRAWVDYQLQHDARFKVVGAASRDELVEHFRTLDKKLNDAAISNIVTKGMQRRPRSIDGQARLITREAEKKRKHIPIRDLITQTSDVIVRLHPCFMMSPHSVSNYLPAKKMFDVVIFDEASQVRPGDAINCLYRGNAIIAAGDQKQLPPTAFFQSNDSEDEFAEEHMSKDYESILDLMKSSGAFPSQTLNWHYRSRHEHLIAFSNQSFYESRLITFPGALADSTDAGVNFYKVPGVYMRGGSSKNPIEAQAVAKRVIHHFTTRPTKSLGVVTFSEPQQDAVEHAVELARKERPDLDQYFTDDRAHGFFVKSLEKVQGDERDVIIFSIGYGPDEHGRMSNNFGPLNRDGGERRLNVAITRAKELVEIVSSISASDIKQSETVGVRHFRRYLDYAENGPQALSLELGPEGRDVESPFEASVAAYVRSLGYDVQPQVGVAGYRIDLGVKHPDQPGAFMLGIECDGAMYHSSRAARDRDRIRHEILEGLGWTLHHIWGTDWYRFNEREKTRLKELLAKQTTLPVKGRLVQKPVDEETAVVLDTVVADFDENPAWVRDYEVAQVTPIPESVDIKNPINAVHLKPFITQVAKAEAPLHMNVLCARIRDNSTYNSIGARMKETITQAIGLAGLSFDGEFITIPDQNLQSVRRNTPAFERSIDQIAPAEIELAIMNVTSDAIGIMRDDLITKTANAFGYARTGPDIRRNVGASIDRLIAMGQLAEDSAGITLANQGATE